MSLKMSIMVDTLPLAALTMFAGLQVYRHRFGVPSLESEHETMEQSGSNLVQIPQVSQGTKFTHRETRSEGNRR